MITHNKKLASKEFLSIFKISVLKGYKAFAFTK